MFYHSSCQDSMGYAFDSTVTLFSPLVTSISESRLLRFLPTSHSSLLLRLMRSPVISPRLSCGLYPLIYLPHLLVLPATLGLHLFRQISPYFPVLYVISVRQTKGLPTASFRFHLTVDTLLFSYVLSRSLRTLETFTR